MASICESTLAGLEATLKKIDDQLKRLDASDR